MAGHSHWKNIARKKGIIDAKRGKHFSKLSRYIIVAARNGGGDPDMNLQLRYAISKARSVSMPKENIDRAIKRGTGDLDGISFDEITYEGYGPDGVMVMAEVMTDNRNRTNGEIKKIFERANGEIGKPGCVSYMFDRKGFFAIDAAKYPDEDALMAVVLDAGADDMNKEDDMFEVTCDPSKFSTVLAALKAANIEPEEAEVKQLAKSLVDVSVETGKKIVRLIEALDDHDDVQNVYTTANLTAEMADA